MIDNQHDYFLRSIRCFTGNDKLLIITYPSICIKFYDNDNPHFGYIDTNQGLKINFII